jgi:hypothetical protein
MHAFVQKRVAFNQRILKNEELVAGINVDLADFLQGMSMQVPLFACVNVGGRMRETQPICGGPWTQEGRRMSATCLPMHGLGKSREEVALSCIVDVQNLFPPRRFSPPGDSAGSMAQRDNRRIRGIWLDQAHLVALRAAVR